jgi:hypothetical protein
MPIGTALRTAREAIPHSTVPRWRSTCQHTTIFALRIAVAPAYRLQLSPRRPHGLPGPRGGWISAPLPRYWSNPVLRHHSASAGIVDDVARQAAAVLGECPLPAWRPELPWKFTRRSGHIVRHNTIIDI